MTNKGNIYTADAGKLIVRKVDDFVMGDIIDLGTEDDIANYEERAFSEEEIAEFFKQFNEIEYEAEH